ncbi:MAG TPA: hypothetical protein VNE63_03785 [Candidatus Acidoferrales bacterium]|nr:hypothetical protein [Candidatus Acidoferrales bacterium]
MRIREMWRRVARTRYTRALEAEVLRLRAENRALLNSILGIAGVPPIPVTAADAAPPPFEPGNPGHRGEDTSERSSVHARRAIEGSASSIALPENDKIRHQPTRKAVGLQTAGPTRRRSWQQINRRLELESARKKTQSTGESSDVLGAARMMLQSD